MPDIDDLYERVFIEIRHYISEIKILCTDLQKITFAYQNNYGYGLYWSYTPHFL